MKGFKASIDGLSEKLDRVEGRLERVESKLDQGVVGGVRDRAGLLQVIEESKEEVREA